MNFIRKTPHINLLVFHDQYDRDWCNLMSQTGLPVVLSIVNGQPPVYDQHQILLYLDPAFEQYQQPDSSLARLLSQSHEHQFILTDDLRWKQVYPNGNPMVLPQKTHPLELVRLLVESGQSVFKLKQ